MKTITSRQNPVVRTFRDLADHPEPTGARVLLDGAHLIAEADAHGIDFEVAAVAESRRQDQTDVAAVAARLASRGVDVISVADQVFDAMSPVRTPSGIVAIARRRPATLRDVLAGSSSLVIVAADIQDPGNVGALIRVAEAAGASGCVVAGASANPFSWKALRGSMGSALRLPVVYVKQVDQVQTSLRHAGLRTFAAVPRGGRDPDVVSWGGGLAILVGGEGPGLSEAVLAASDERVTIPMADPVESLNVAVAAALLLYSARRQRMAQPLDSRTH